MIVAIAAAVLGGCSLRGGEGSIIGVVIGAAIRKDVWLLLRDRGALISLFLLPIAFMLAFGLMFGGSDGDGAPRPVAICHAPGDPRGEARVPAAQRLHLDLAADQPVDGGHDPAHRPGAAAARHAVPADPLGLRPAPERSRTRLDDGFDPRRAQRRRACRDDRSPASRESA